jgi:hypothetical protein
MARIYTKQKFYQETIILDEITVDKHIEIFRELGAIAENYLKLVYGVVHKYRTDKEIETLEKTQFYDIWKSITNDSSLKVFITKPFPNTIFWNASKHDGITKKVNHKEIEFKANEGYKIRLCKVKKESIALCFRYSL